ncbi:MAG: pentapeptide repeat-containing protein [Oscillospiraceae bacterium]|nr:pentapeptide repeat-containing protein [Oscillospiraceae bacterium]
MAKNKKGQSPPNPKNLKWVVVVFVFLGILVGVAVFFVFLRLFAPDDPQTSDLYEIARTTVTLLGALTVGGAAVIQYRKHIVLEHQAQIEREARQDEREQLQLERDASYSERLTRAIDHLGSEKLSIRKGAVYELKHLAEDSEKIRHDIIRILESHIREKIEDKAREIEKSKAKAEEKAKVKVKTKAVDPRPEEDVFIAANITAELCKSFNDKVVLEGLFAIVVTLFKMNFKGANLVWAELQDANLRVANLQGADLRSANLQGADLRWAELQGADLGSANLQGADLRWAELQGADLRSANLQGADLRSANLRGADLRWANFQGADLSWAELQGANLTMANLQGAVLRSADLRDAIFEDEEGKKADLFKAKINKDTQLDEGVREKYFQDAIWVEE